MDEVTATLLEQEILKAKTRIDMIAERGADSANFVKARAEENFLLAGQLVGAMAAANLGKDALASAILQQRAAKEQPDKAPSAPA